MYGHCSINKVSARNPGFNNHIQLLTMKRYISAFYGVRLLYTGALHSEREINIVVK